LKTTGGIGFQIRSLNTPFICPLQGCIESRMPVLGDLLLFVRISIYDSSVFSGIFSFVDEKQVGRQDE
tara:strand:+ start:676 stop:879 length:204 start_codon:yes stop_codon:yes gene_type:complete